MYFNVNREIFLGLRLVLILAPWRITAQLGEVRGEEILSDGINGAAGVQSPLFDEDAVNGESRCHVACTNLVNELGNDIVHYGPSNELAGFAEGYFSRFQRIANPACVVTPKTAEQVSRAVSILYNLYGRIHSEAACPLSMKSGGHGSFAGQSNAYGGVTFDLKLLNQLEYLGEKDWDWDRAEDSAGQVEKDVWTGRITRIGPGNRWKDVYAYLEPFGMTVPGGRASGVGVGGFTLGGGISFLSRRYGWAIDNVRNYQVILPNGTLTNVNHKSSPSVYWALRGGSNNFGIVTRFDIETHPQGSAWGGYSFWLTDPAEIQARQEKAKGLIGISSASNVTRGFGTAIAKAIPRGLLSLGCKLGYCTDIANYHQTIVDVVKAAQKDTYAQFLVCFSYVRQIDAYMFVDLLGYSKEFNGTVEGVGRKAEKSAVPKVFEGLWKTKSAYSSNKARNLTSLTNEADSYSEHNLWQDWGSATFLINENTTTFLSDITDKFLAETQPLRDIDGVIMTIVLQPINTDEIKIFSKNGGNCLGIGPDEGPLILFSTNFEFKNVLDIPAVRKAVKNIYTYANQISKELNVYHRFIYSNYANSTQDVFGGYGEENKQRLREIQSQLDPKGFWRTSLSNGKL